MVSIGIDKLTILVFCDQNSTHGNLHGSRGNLFANATQLHTWYDEGFAVSMYTHPLHR